MKKPKNLQWATKKASADCHPDHNAFLAFPILLTIHGLWIGLTTQPQDCLWEFWWWLASPNKILTSTTSTALSSICLHIQNQNSSFDLFTVDWFVWWWARQKITIDGRLILGGEGGRMVGGAVGEEPPSGKSVSSWQWLDHHPPPTHGSQQPTDLLRIKPKSLTKGEKLSQKAIKGLKRLTNLWKGKTRSISETIENQFRKP